MLGHEGTQLTGAHHQSHSTPMIPSRSSYGLLLRRPNDYPASHETETTQANPGPPALARLPGSHCRLVTVNSTLWPPIDEPRYQKYTAGDTSKRDSTNRNINAKEPSHRKATACACRFHECILFFLALSLDRSAKSYPFLQGSSHSLLLGTASHDCLEFGSD